MTNPRWLADEMLGRLARYLRFVGEDVLYVRGAADDEVIARARAEDRVILTRDRVLARRAAGAILLSSSEIRGQWEQLRATWPGLGTEVRFLRCTRCNGEVHPYLRGSDPARESGLLPQGARPDLALFACSVCGHLYWEGSHTASIRARLRAWAEGGSD